MCLYIIYMAHRFIDINPKQCIGVALQMPENPFCLPLPDSYVFCVGPCMDSQVLCIIRDISKRYTYTYNYS